MKFISLFAGIGGFDLALTRNGHECVWVNEWDKYAAQIYDKNFNEVLDSPYQGQYKTKGTNSQDGLDTRTGQRQSGNRIDTRDIRTVPTSEIPDHDLLVGGFPCQAFSIAGKRRGFDDTRGTLFFEVARILRDKKPRLFILENVKGLLSHDNGNTFKTIINTLVELGYDLQWQVLNSKNFGVPQNRERVFIIGHLRGTGRSQVFPIGQNVGLGKQEGCVANTLTSNYWKGPAAGRPFIQEGGNKSNSYNTIRRATYSNDCRIRRLTPTECERLQGFPDGWTEGVSDTQRYKCLGNAVTVNVVEHLVKILI